MGIALDWDESGDAGQTLISQVVGINDFPSLGLQRNEGEGKESKLTWSYLSQS